MSPFVRLPLCPPHLHRPVATFPSCFTLPFVFASVLSIPFIPPPLPTYTLSPPVCIPLTLFTLQFIVSSLPPTPSSPSSSHPKSCTDIAQFLHHICFSLVLFHCFYYFFSPFPFLSLSAWGSSSDIISPTVTMVSGERDHNNCLDQTERLSTVIWKTHRNKRGSTTSKGIAFYYRIQIQFTSVGVDVMCVCVLCRSGQC